VAPSDFTNLRKESFAIESDMLVRRVVPWRGKPYQHRCDHAAYEDVAHTIDELGGEPFGLEDLQQRTRLPWTRIATALAFYGVGSTGIYAVSRMPSARGTGAGAAIALEAARLGAERGLAIAVTHAAGPASAGAFLAAGFETVTTLSRYRWEPRRPEDRWGNRVPRAES